MNDMQNIQDMNRDIEHYCNNRTCWEFCYGEKIMCPLWDEPECWYDADDPALSTEEAAQQLTRNINLIWPERSLGESNPKVDHPTHYNTGSIECIVAMEAAFGTDAVMHFCLCNAFKYLWRQAYKGKGEDIDKAIWYLIKYKELAYGD